jgi:chromosome segregation ATPase
MRVAAICLLCLVGCVTRTELHEEINDLKTKQDAAEARLRALASQVAGLEGITETVKAELLKGQRSEVEELRGSLSRAVQESRELRQELNHSLDEAVAGIRRDLTRVHNDVEREEAARAVLAQELEKRLTTLEKDVLAVQSGGEQRTARLEQVREQLDQARQQVEQMSGQVKAMKAAYNQVLAQLKTLEASLAEVQEARAKPDSDELRKTERGESPQD